jgi:hypothetical protein
MAKKKKSAEKKARVHKDLEGFEIKVNPLGEITSNYNIDQINKFLDKNVYDKKLTKKDEDPIEDSSDAEENDEDFLKGSDEDADDDLPPKSRGSK